jgi:hypothetical protein
MSQRTETYYIAEGAPSNFSHHGKPGRGANAYGLTDAEKAEILRKNAELDALDGGNRVELIQGRNSGITRDSG